MPTVEDILELLENGKWHDLKEIGEKIQLSDLEVESVTKFLAQHDFISLDEEEKRAKIDLSTRHFLERIRQVEGEEKL